MCGITGFWQRRPLDESAPSTLDAMMHRLHHRGPDGVGRHLDPQRGLAMGHTRLSIIDLDTGAQPLSLPDAGLVLTVNGEFYDFKPIRARLACDGERFRCKSDSEIALHLYRRDGLDFVHRLRGEFACALFDEKRERLVLVRDRFGIKPLYYRVAEGAFFWGSEVKSILAHPDVPARLDRRALLNQLMHTMVPGTTAFEGIRALRPGHMLIVSRENDGWRIEERCYWDMTFPHADDYDADPNPDDYVLGVRDRMIDAVRVRLEADVPVGCYLSGGIDSCSILGVATAMRQDPVKAFTIGFDASAFDETEIAREMAESVGADQDVLRLGAAELYGDAYRKTLWHAERTFYNTLGVAKYHMSRHVRDAGYKVVVTGEGSDELFAGYAQFKRDLFLHGVPEAEREARAAELAASNAVFEGSILPERSTSHPAMDALCGFTPSWIQPWLLALERARPLLSDDAASEIGDYDPVSAIAETLDASRLEGRHPLDKAQYTWIKTMLEGQILTWGGDRVDMGNSVESRPAFLDHHVAEYAATIPPQLRVRDGVEKWVLREAMRGVLPERLYKREKFAFMAPPAHVDDAKAQAVQRMIDRHLARDAIEAAGLFDPDRVAAFLAERTTTTASADSVRNDVLLNHLLCMQLLHESFVESDTAVPAA